MSLEDVEGFIPDRFYAPDLLPDDYDIDSCNSQQGGKHMWTHELDRFAEAEAATRVLSGDYHGWWRQCQKCDLMEFVSFKEE